MTTVKSTVDVEWDGCSVGAKIQGKNRGTTFQQLRTARVHQLMYRRLDKKGVNLHARKKFRKSGLENSPITPVVMLIVLYVTCEKLLENNRTYRVAVHVDVAG